MGIIAVGIPGEARTAATRPGQPASKQHRRSKLVAAFAITALVGAGSYAGTYRALTIVSTPATGHTVAPAAPAAPTAAHP